jgi:hypothetical protein
MKLTKHASTNYRALAPFLDATDRKQDKAAKFLAPGYMPLCVECVGYSVHGCPVYSIAHYGEQNGDAMRDPEMTVAVDRKAGTVDPLTYRNDYMGVDQEVYTERNGKEFFRPNLRTSLDDFLWHWLKNLKDQGFDPAKEDA